MPYPIPSIHDTSSITCEASTSLCSLDYLVSMDGHFEMTPITPYSWVQCVDDILAR